MKSKILAFIGSMALCISFAVAQKLKVCIVGLNHDHIYNVLNAYKNGQVDIIGIAEPNHELWSKYGKQFNLPYSVFYDDTKAMLKGKKPDAVLGYNAVGDHVDIVEVCAPLHIPVMVEKPLAATLVQANRIQALAAQYHIKVLTNYETTWYPSGKYIYDEIAADSIGVIRKMVVHDGHQGPKEIGCSKEFLAWLTDPVQNGAGALNDFGCYGADLMTWLMHGQKPVSVTAITRQYRPTVYPKVDDDATILVEYPKAMGQIEASWNWPYSIKDLEVFGDHGYLHSLNGTDIDIRMRENRRSSVKAQPLPEPINDPLVYLDAVLHGKLAGTDDQASLKYNMIVMQILDAAKRSAKEGRKILL
ncbi:MAG TPA: Gfo/Idh/MocA family oxidoreductase [Mucilaginibacter sp.]|jgi:predicted dehydrogenase|nr:Gfo/Idh/MocA family oxidoreductase [Mucilaginibacter sp.]